MPPRNDGVEVFSYDPYWDYLVKSEGFRRFEYKKALFPFELSEKLSFFHVALPPPVEPYKSSLRAARRLNQYLFSLDTDDKPLLPPEYPREKLEAAKKRYQDVTHRYGRRVIFLL